MHKPLPQVVEFDHQYDVHLEHSGATTRIVSSLKAKPYHATYKKFHDLPFCRIEGNGNVWSFWSFPKAANYREADQRGHYFWEEFVRYARGSQKRRREDALWAIRQHILPALMGRGGDEASVFLNHLCETVIDAVRVGVE